MDDELDRAAKKHRLQQRHGALRVAENGGGVSGVSNVHLVRTLQYTLRHYVLFS
jgi:hypothetical protein